MDFSEALKALKSGKKLTRLGWKTDAYIVYMNETPTASHYIKLVLYEDYGRECWGVSQLDVLAEDWVIF